MGLSPGFNTRNSAAWPRFSVLLVLMAMCPQSSVAETRAESRFRKDIQPILTQYCYDCHGDGMSKGKVAFDGFQSHDERLARRDLWLAVLKNLRAGIMPPEKKPRPSEEELQRLQNWIKRAAFGIDPKNPDPGRVTIRRLNRVEYRNTIRDLMGFDFRVEEELPPDDTGYGFDNIGDVLTVSPLLLEKYMQAAEKVVAVAVPRVGKVVQETNLPGSAFRKAEEKSDAKGGSDKYTFYEEAKVSQVFKAEKAGSYRLALELEVAGQFDFDPGRCPVVFKAGDRQLLEQEFGWQNSKKFRFDFDEQWEPGEHPLSLELQPLTPVE